MKHALTFAAYAVVILASVSLGAYISTPKGVQCFAPIAINE